MSRYFTDICLLTPTPQVLCAARRLHQIVTGSQQEIRAPNPPRAQDRILRRLNRKEHSESCGKIPAPGIHGGVSHRTQSDMDYSAAGPQRVNSPLGCKWEVERCKPAARRGARQNSSPIKPQRTEDRKSTRL